MRKKRKYLFSKSTNSGNPQRVNRVKALKRPIVAIGQKKAAKVITLFCVLNNFDIEREQNNNQQII